MGNDFRVCVGFANTNIAGRRACAGVTRHAGSSDGAGHARRRNAAGHFASLEIGSIMSA
jgi:hypothetical protein